MAFGTWLKNIIGKIGSAVKKAIPIAKKVVAAVAPAVHQIGGMIGGPIGTGIQKIAGVAGKFVDKAETTKSCWRKWWRHQKIDTYAEVNPTFAESKTRESAQLNTTYFYP